VNTLDAIAEAHGPSAVDRLVLIGAGRGELFGARFDPAGSPPHGIDGPWVASPQAVVSRIGAGTLPLAVPAPGTEDLLQRSGFVEAGIRIGAPPRSIAAAAGRLALATGLLDRDRPDTLAPLYLRPPDAVLKPARR
jgi:tRNA A37 threonylcarbamoyladenosine modification protein TsaB